jgi:hypothetical protein
LSVTVVFAVGGGAGCCACAENVPMMSAAVTLAKLIRHMPVLPL